MLKKNIPLIVLMLLVGSLIGICIYRYIIPFLIVFGVFDKDYSVTELKQNFDLKQVEIYELKEYFNEIVPMDKSVEIEFESKNKLAKFSITGFRRIVIGQYLQNGK